MARDTSAARYASVAGVTEIRNSCNECTVTETRDMQSLDVDHGGGVVREDNHTKRRHVTSWLEWLGPVASDAARVVSLFRTSSVVAEQKLVPSGAARRVRP